MARLTGGLALMSAGILVAFLVAELVLRIAGVSYFFAFRGDERTGLAHIPGAEGTFRDEGEAFVRINRAGFRDVDRSKAKPRDVLRIAVLGDSYTEAFHVPFESAFTSVAERELATCLSADGRRVEVLNFGLSSFGTAQEMILLRSTVLEYSPDLVLLAFLTENDIIDNSRALSGQPDRPYFTLSDGSLVLDDRYRALFGNRGSPLLNLFFGTLPHSRVLQIVNNARSALTERETRAANRVRYADVAGGVVQSFAAARMLYREPTIDSWRDAWDVTEALLRTINAEVRAHGATFMVATLSNEAQVHPDKVSRADLTRDLGVNDLFYPDRRIQDAGRRDDFRVIALAPELQSFADRSGDYLHGFGDRLGHGHWNSLGHRVAGEAIARETCPLLRERSR